MKKFKLINTFLLILFCNISFSQKQSFIKGTIIVAAIINDSILMVSDTRAGIGATDITCKDAVGYIDSLPKIFQLKSYLIATSGEAMIGPNFIQQIINDFNNYSLNNLDFQTTVLNFQAYLDSLYPISKYSSSANQVFIAAGLFFDKPQTITFNRGTLKAMPSAFASTGINSNDPRIFDYIQRQKIKSFDCKSLGIAIEKAIYEFAKNINKESCIGGPITIAKITSLNKIVWVQNNFTIQKYSTFIQFVDLIKQNIINLFPLTENGKAKAINWLESNPYYVH
jgi:hypothetical protein